jgi:hypothetical protein
MILPIIGDTLGVKNNEYLITDIDPQKAICKCNSIKNTKITVDVYFKNINKINNVKVEYVPARNVFNSYGTIKRVVNIPTKNDIIALGDKVVAVVDYAKLVDGKLLIVDTEKVKHLASDITDVDYVDYGKFNKKTFASLYASYI